MDEDYTPEEGKIFLDVFNRNLTAGKEAFFNRADVRKEF